MKKQLVRMTALAGLVTSLALAAIVSAGQSTSAHSATNASGEVRTATPYIDWP